MHLLIAVDWRLGLALAILLIAGLSKGVTGLGAPALALPVLALAYPFTLVIAVLILPTIASDVVMVARLWRHAAGARRLLVFALGGLIGIVIGTNVLVRVNPNLLKGLLGVVVLVFVATSWSGRLPSMTRRLERVAGGVTGLVAGALQGSAGSSGPLVTMYLFDLGLDRLLFLFSINALFLVLDVTQFVALHQVGLVTGGTLLLALLGGVPLLLGVAGGLALQGRIDDAVFRRVVLSVLGLVGAGLVAQSILQFVRGYV
ncbi:MAG: TSUP family transporter [bacterium]|nr:TSUP family transporter [bacterium]